MSGLSQYDGNRVFENGYPKNYQAGNRRLLRHHSVVISAAFTGHNFIVCGRRGCGVELCITAARLVYRLFAGGSCGDVSHLYETDFPSGSDGSIYGLPGTAGSHDTYKISFVHFQ